MVDIMEVDIGVFWHNIDEIKKRLKPGTKIMPVVKANAYGTYLNKRLDILNKFEIVAVANVYEAKELRKLGYKKEIFVLIQPDVFELDEIEEYDISIGLSSIEFLKEAVSKKNKIKAHIEIETGMGRTGVYLKDLKEFVNIVKNSNIKVEGVYTHFAAAEYDLDFTKSQIQKFEKAVEYIKGEFQDDLKYIHSQASSGILNTEVPVCNFVRPGALMYGCKSLPSNEKIDLKSITKLRSRINYIKTIEKGENVSYGRKFTAEKQTRVATVPMGYADGIKRCLSNKGEVVINGKKAPILGVVCMDSCMVDVTHIPDAKVGDDVYAWDNKIIKLDEVSEKCDTINYEILIGVSNRVKRIFIGDRQNGK